MADETVDEKGQRLYSTGAVKLVDEWDEPPTWKYQVTGDTGTHSVIADINSMGCDCDARGACSHQVAVRLYMERGGDVAEAEVVAEDSGGEDGPHSQGGIPSPPEHPAALAVHTANVSEPASELGAMLLSPRKEFRDQAWGTLAQITQTNMVPKQYQGNPGAALAAVLLGRDWGIGPVESLQYIDNINGSVEPNAEFKMRMYRRAGHRITETAFDKDGVTVTGQRGDTGESMAVTFTFKDAERMKLLDKTNWKNDPESMLWARAVSRLVRRLAPDCMDRQP